MLSGPTVRKRKKGGSHDMKLRKWLSILLALLMVLALLPVTARAEAP